MAKVPCDPAQVAVNAPSFRVRLRAPVVSRALADTARFTRVPAPAPAPARRRPPVVWSGRTRPGGDTAATRLLQAVRYSEEGAPEEMGTTQVLPRIAIDEGPPTVIGPRSPRTETVPRSGAGGGPGQRPPRAGELSDPDRNPARARERYEEQGAQAAAPRPRRHADSVRHAYYPGRRMNLGIVLLPLRIFLGFISVYAGMGKLSDPVYFDGGERGSMVTWLRSLHPWPIAEPLRDLALEHPVGAGLTVAFLQIVVGVLTILGLWQRLAAGFGALLSAALILTVSWRTVPVYDAPDIIYLAAWSPLVIAGAPVYSADARLAGEAWRRLGPRAELWDLRRRVLRRGSVMALVIAGLTLLIGSSLGGAVRSSETVRAPEPRDVPTNSVPGSPLPRKSMESPRGGMRGSVGTSGSPSPSEGLRTSPSQSGSASPSAPGETSATGSIDDSGSPSQSHPGLGTTPHSPRRAPVAPRTTMNPPSLGGGAGGGVTGGEPEGAPEEDSGDGGYSEGGGEQSGLGGLLG
ncbi:DoxX family membrane protein [Streptomyces sp. NPDC048636]|uniref:DoxX family membrane protein n=1 Tax=Streptomyces sp. NPDC048636 TaxID=3155762 RepID=UPI00341E0616